jgi:hypothetical protein
MGNGDGGELIARAELRTISRKAISKIACGIKPFLPGLLLSPVDAEACGASTGQYTVTQTTSAIFHTNGIRKERRQSQT